MQNTLLFPELDKQPKANEDSFTYSILNKLGAPKPTEVYDTYWKFAAERQAVFFRKQHKRLPPWTNDPILAKYKFTNAYRASDRVSQYLIKKIIYAGDPTPDETFFRIILFKTFNKIETWELLERNFGPISFANYSYDAYDKVLSEAMKQKHSIYSGAYIMASGKSIFGFNRKHQNHLKLIEKMMHDKVPSKICELKSMDELFNLLYSYPTIGQFLAYQYATDINYSDLTEFDEMEFVIPGPGARDGIKKCFSDLGDFNESEIIRLMADKQEEEFDRLGISFLDLWGRSLQLIDCQNLFCEVDKYARVAHPKVEGISKRTRIKQKYQPISKPLNYWYPPKWGINSSIGKDIEV